MRFSYTRIYICIYPHMKIECNIKFDSSRQFNKLLLIKASLLNEIITCTVRIKPENQEKVIS